MTRASFNDAVTLERLQPFGLCVIARSPRAIESWPPSLLARLARDERLVVLRGFAPVDRDAFLAYCRSFQDREILEWDFGPVMEMHERPDAKNYLFSREAVPFHWDGAFHRVPHFLMFYCVEAPTPGAGGETLFCDTTRLWADLPSRRRERLSHVELTYETQKLAHYGGTVTGPLVATHPVTGEKVLRFAEPVETALNPVSMRVHGIPDQEHGAFLQEMRERIYDEAYCYRHTWEPHDTLIADNHALIHARRAFERDCPRHLRRIQLI